jgi:hypothetical protein
MQQVVERIRRQRAIPVQRCSSPIDQSIAISRIISCPENYGDLRPSCSILTPHPVIMALKFSPIVSPVVAK